MFDKLVQPACDLVNDVAALSGGDNNTCVQGVKFMRAVLIINFLQQLMFMTQKFNASICCVNI